MKGIPGGKGLSKREVSNNLYGGGEEIEGRERKEGVSKGGDVLGNVPKKNRKTGPWEGSRRVNSTKRTCDKEGQKRGSEKSHGMLEKLESGARVCAESTGRPGNTLAPLGKA